MTRQTRPLHIVLDFDGTITKRDTTAILGSITSITGAQPYMTWDDILKAYMNDYDAFVENYKSSPADRKTVAEEAAWLNSTRLIELRSVKRVEEAGFFRGATTGIIGELASQRIKSGDVALRPGWDDLVSLPLSRPQTRVSILSVNWSATFIRQTLLAYARETLGDEAGELVNNINSINIHANEIEGLEKPAGSNGKLGSEGGIRTSGDKLACLKTMSANAGIGSDSGTEPATDGDLMQQTDASFTVYVGDSPSDLECLATADLGICVRDQDMGNGQRELASCFARLQLDVLPIDMALANGRSATSAVSWTKDLKSVADILSKW